MIVGPHSTKLPQSWNTESDQLGPPAVLPEQLHRGPCFLLKQDIRPLHRFTIGNQALVDRFFVNFVVLKMVELRSFLGFCAPELLGIWSLRSP